MMLACGGRLPAQSTAKNLIRKHFNKYGKKYEASPFGGKKVTSVEILKIDEIHKHLVSAISFVTIEGPEVFKVRMVIEKGPFGWRTVSWENLSGG
ncbi:MAG: hypothetical protein HY609_03980 [Deltaproteobacteria bacterium]|nr:hypothetical protein [Deltaproteobacteria bacterium]